MNHKWGWKEQQNTKGSTEETQLKLATFRHVESAADYFKMTCKIALYFNMNWEIEHKKYCGMKTDECIEIDIEIWEAHTFLI